jgi:hypothetical protein
VRQETVYFYRVIEGCKAAAVAQPPCFVKQTVSPHVITALLRRGVLTQFLHIWPNQVKQPFDKNLIRINGLVSRNRLGSFFNASFRRTSQRSKIPRIPLLLRHLQTAVRADSGRRA